MRFRFCSGGYRVARILDLARESLRCEYAVIIEYFDCGFVVAATHPATLNAVFFTFISIH